MRVPEPTVTVENGQPRLIAADSPSSAVFELSSACNLRCRFCYRSDSTPDVTAPVERATRILDELSAAHVEKVVFVGGEPFLYPGWTEVLGHARHLGLTASFVSNGTLISATVAQEISALLGEGVVSIHGDETIHDRITQTPGSYRDAVAGLKALTDRGIRAGVYYTLTRDNYSSILDVAGDLVHGSETGVRWLAVNRDLPYGAGSDYFTAPLGADAYHRVFEQLSTVEREFGIPAFLEVGLPLCRVDPRFHRFVLACRVGICNTVIDPHGTMRLCPVVTDTPIGNVLQQPLLAMWHDAPALQQYRSLEWLPRRCTDCRYLGRCLGGCWAANSGATANRRDVPVRPDGPRLR